MTRAADYAVIRPAPDLPAGFLPDEYDGKWFDRAQIRPGYEVAGGAVAVPTGRFEYNDDGQCAEVYEVRP